MLDNQIMEKRCLEIAHQQLQEIITLTREKMSEGRYLLLNQLCTQDITLIAEIAKSECITAKGISESLMLPKTTVVSAVSRLVQRGYVAKSVNEKDKRESFLTLTEKGMRVHEEHLSYEKELIRAYFDKWDLSEKQALLALLQKGREKTC